jgi:hypothetical protein
VFSILRKFAALQHEHISNYERRKQLVKSQAVNPSQGLQTSAHHLNLKAPTRHHGP